MVKHFMNTIITSEWNMQKNYFANILFPKHLRCADLVIDTISVKYLKRKKGSHHVNSS